MQDALGPREREPEEGDGTHELRPESACGLTDLRGRIAPWLTSPVAATRWLLTARLRLPSWRSGWTIFSDMSGDEEHDLA